MQKVFILAFENVSKKLTILANKNLLFLPVFYTNLPIIGVFRLAALMECWV